MVHNAFGSATACGAQAAVARTATSEPAIRRSHVLVGTAAQHDQVWMVGDGSTRTGVLGVTDQVR